ncbi:glycosyltransferase [Clostridiisalibacter paucivorans]|uniref:glycosyltransferase n=1 Tax=Clostridiisalibacter paucivorans TaxID=408753 RepID=UPI0004799201|nr:glycosyltransferase [Clostridiisalibacter paucivorans]
MKKALMVAYQFPPMGGSGVQRTTKFVKYMPEYQWEPVVFTREVKNIELKDETLLGDIPSNTKIIRTKSWDLTELPGVLKLGGKAIARKILIPDGERLWQIFNEKKAIDIIRKENIDLIYTTSYPYSDHLLGLKLKKKFPQIPWVADFRDEWTKNPYLLDNPHYSLRMNIERNMEKQIMEGANYIITNTPIMMKNFIDSYPFTKEKFCVIPNGYDETDFQGTSEVDCKRDKFVITYTGSFYGRRSPETFFQSIKDLVHQGKIEEDKIQIQLIGNYIVKRLDALIKKYGLENMVHILPYMEHRESIKELIKSNVLLLIVGAGPGAEAFYTGKVFEYMRTGRPILALVPEEGVAADVIKETDTGLVSDSRDIEKIKENICKLYNKWTRGERSIDPDWTKVKSFDRKALTKRLVDVFDNVIS